MKSHHLTFKTIIDRPIAEVFKFFSNAENLSRLTPPDVHFKILTPLPIIITQGTLIDYHIKLNGFAFNWQTEITIWEPPFRFVDIQKKGPYKIWKHEHCFEEIQGKTQMMDLVEYLSPGWVFEPAIDALYVRKKIYEIFNFRTKQIEIWVNERK